MAAYKYSLFIDDERYPAEDRVWHVVRSSRQAIKAVKTLGMPEHIAFDHDLGDGDTSMEFVHWLVAHALENDLDFNFTYDVHSQNPVGESNIRGLIESFKASGRTTPGASDADNSDQALGEGTNSST